MHLTQLLRICIWFRCCAFAFDSSLAFAFKCASPHLSTSMTHTRTHTHTRTRTHKHTRTHAHTHTLTHAHTLTRTYTHIHSHTRTHLNGTRDTNSWDLSVCQRKYVLIYWTKKQQRGMFRPLDLFVDVDDVNHYRLKTNDKRLSIEYGITSLFSVLIMNYTTNTALSPC